MLIPLEYYSKCRENTSLFRIIAQLELNPPSSNNVLEYAINVQD